MALEELFGKEIRVVNLGVESFHHNLKDVGAFSTHVHWRPPAVADTGAWENISRETDRINHANAEALKIILSGKPVLTGMDIARNVIPGMHPRMILHSGPPITWDRMCGPTRGAIMGALVYEGLAADPAEAEVLAASGEIEFSPCHEHASVGPMAGIISASMPVFIIKNETHGNLAFCTQNEGLGKVLRYGAYSKEVIERLKWMETVMYPVLRDALVLSGPIDIKNLVAQALHMGDEVHNRNRAGTSLFYRAIAPAIVESCENRNDAAAVLRFINSNDHFFLNLSMPASKAILDAARNIPNAGVVVVMARNGTDFGIQLSGTGNRWFTGAAPVPDALFFPGFSKDDANPDIGDSAITETAGLGGFAIAAAPAIVQFVGGRASDAMQYTLDMYEITAGENNVFQIPSLDFRGTPTGIDVVKVVRNNITPFIDTGVAHKNPGIGQVGAGVVSAPIEPFINAFTFFAGQLNK